MLLNNESEQHRWSMAKMFATNEVNNGVLTLIHGTSNKFDSVVQHLEGPLNKPLILIKND